ncbi:unnamed protein product [Paramecium pentaurelia]|uniref:Uncharacterized protein n=1 Tax=Paramecium pentaurelia TaxID=43138 RepID=A0A8S1Y1J1_9CILI|nr:unnamed protein product [Paramecium pentaurelia]
MFSSNKIISEFDFFDTKKIQFINEKQKNKTIQLYESTSQIKGSAINCISIKKKKFALISIPQVISSNLESCKTLSNFSISDFIPIQIKNGQGNSQDLILHELRNQKENKITTQIGPLDFQYIKDAI